MLLTYLGSKKVWTVARGGGGEATGKTPYTYYQPTFGPKYVSFRPYNEFVMPTNFIKPIIAFSMDSRYRFVAVGIPWLILCRRVT